MPPRIAGAEVNAIDYLTAGLYTQKRYTDNTDVAQGLLKGSSLSRLNTRDIPTEPANSVLALDEYPRGYEMGEGPISLSNHIDSLVETSARKPATTMPQSMATSTCGTTVSTTPRSTRNSSPSKTTTRPTPTASTPSTASR